MKISSHQLFDLVDEYAVEMLLDESSVDDSYETTLLGVQDLISSTTITFKKNSFKMRFFILAAALIIMTSGLSFAIPYKSAELIDVSNRHLIGKNDVERIIIYDNNGALTYGQPPHKIKNDVWRTSSIIKKVEFGTTPPKSITEFKTIYNDGKYVTPEVMFDNGDFIIFTKENGDGWNLEKGDFMTITVNEYETEDKKRQAITYFQITNGTFHKSPIYDADTLKQEFKLVAEKSGEYFICLACSSSEHIALKPGEICVKTSK